MPRVALVTGGSRGIGRGIVTALLGDGFAVAILDTREEPADLASLRAADEVVYVRGSVADADAHEALVGAVLGRWGRIDVLVNNAGVAPEARTDILHATPESYDEVMATNLRGPYFLTQRVAREMLRVRDGELSGVAGTIVNISSISAITASTDRGEYCISKAGVAMATQLWAARLAEEGILVYEVRPGVIATDMTSGVREKYDALFGSGMAPIPRWGTPEDVAAAVAQLCAAKMPYSTGDVIHVDGGMHLRRL